MLNRISLCIVCFSTVCSSQTFASSHESTVSFEVTPNVVRTDGSDSAYVEVNMNGPANRVYLKNIFPEFIVPDEQRNEYDLHDDGLNGDRVAGDYIFTGGPFTYDATKGNPAFFYYGLDMVDSPYGVRDYAIASLIEFVDSDGVPGRLLHGPRIILLDANLAVPDSKRLSVNMHATANVVNLKTTTKIAQHNLRSLSGSSITDASKSIYKRLPDNFDFLYLLPTSVIERVPYNTGQNFVKGTSVPAQVDFTGSAVVPRDDTATFGSNGRLKSFITLDTLRRGMETNNALHEMMHYWLVRFDQNLGINVGSHYNPFSNTGGILRGGTWSTNSDGTYTRDCPIPPTFTEATSLEKYMMGLEEAEQVEPVLMVDNSVDTVYQCGQPIVGNIRTTTIEDIQAIHGPRLPGVADSQKQFNIGFVIETNDRFLTEPELVFYDLMARHFTKTIAEGEPNPVIRQYNWASINRFFGPGVSFTSDVPYLVPPAVTNVSARSKRYKVNVVWDALEDADSYLVYSKANYEDDFKLVGEVAYPVFVDQIPRDATNVTYYITAKNTHGVGPESATVVAVPTTRRRR